MDADISELQQMLKDFDKNVSDMSGKVQERLDEFEEANEGVEALKERRVQEVRRRRWRLTRRC